MSARSSNSPVNLSFVALRKANITRRMEWPGAGAADVAFRAIEVAGEAGEVAESIKKLLRKQRGIGGSGGTVADVADEVADCVIALDLLAESLGVDLAEAVVSKFNKTSKKYGLETRLKKRRAVA